MADLRTVLFMAKAVIHDQKLLLATCCPLGFPVSAGALKAEASSEVGLLFHSHPAETFSSLPPEDVPDIFGFRIVDSGLVAATYVKQKRRRVGSV